MPARCEDGNREQRSKTPSWEPEPLQLPIELPRRPEPVDDTPPAAESRVIVIDLV